MVLYTVTKPIKLNIFSSCARCASGASFVEWKRPNVKISLLRMWLSKKCQINQTLKWQAVNRVQFDEGGNRKDFVFISGFSLVISPYEFSVLSCQILMSVQPKPVRVMSTLTAQTVKVLTAVLVNRDLLEMGQHVKVNQDNQLIRNLFFHFFYQLKRGNPLSQILYIFKSDDDILQKDSFSLKR